MEYFFEVLLRPSIAEPEKVLTITLTLCWMDLIKNFLKDVTLQEEEEQRRKVKRQAPHFARWR